MKSTLVDVKTASEKLSLSPQQVRNLCRTGKIKSEKVGKSWIMRDYDINNYYDNNSCGSTEDQTLYSSDIASASGEKHVALSFFSGAMGMDLGLEKAGFEISLCCETDNACRKTILKNRPNIALIGDILDYTATQIRLNAGLRPDQEIDLIVGGPPCQAFSTAGKRKGFKDKRGNVFLSFVDKIIELKPKFAVIENVRGILSAPLEHRPHIERGKNTAPLSEEEQKGGVLYFIIQKLKRNGYGVSFNLYNSANFGTPQKRERVVMVCSRDGKVMPYLTPTHSEDGSYNLKRWRTYKEAVKGLKKKGLQHLEFPHKRIQYYKLLKPGQYWRHLPENLQKKALGATYYTGGGRTGFFRRLAWNKPSPTLVTHPAMPATDLAHPTENRPLSIEEYKRLQEFPDDWQVEGSLIEQYRQIGNAVPISLGAAIGKLLKNHMAGKKAKSFLNFPYSRYKNTDDKNWIKVFDKSRNRDQQRLLKI